MTLGLGAMIQMLGGNADSVDAWKAAKGKTIAALALVPDGDGALVFTFEDGSRMQITDEGRSCCESRYMTCDDNLDAFVGATLMEAETRDGPSEEKEYDRHDTAFLVVTTSKGAFTVCTHNEHNGYYGGFAIRCATLEPAP